MGKVNLSEVPMHELIDEIKSRIDDVLDISCLDVMILKHGYFADPIMFDQAKLGRIDV